MWQAILTLIAAIIPTIPSLVTDAENVFRNQPQSGAQKAASVVQFVAPLIQSVSQDVAKLAPAGTDAQKIANAVNVYAKAVNDATVVLANDLGVFPHTTSPAGS